MNCDERTLELLADKIAHDIATNPHSYQKHCLVGREIMKMDGQPISRTEYKDLIKRTLLDKDAQARVVGGDQGRLAVYSHKTRMVVVVNPRRTNDGSTAYPLSGKPPLNPEMVTDLLSHAKAHNSIHDNLIYNHGDGFPHHARDAFHAQFEMRDVSGRFMGKNRMGEPVKPIGGPQGALHAWMLLHGVPQKLYHYFNEQAVGQKESLHTQAYSRNPQNYSSRMRH